MIFNYRKRWARRLGDNGLFKSHRNYIRDTFVWATAMYHALSESVNGNYNRRFGPSFVIMIE